MHIVEMALLYHCKWFFRLSTLWYLSVIFRTYNDPGQRSNFINGTGAVDIYGLVSRPAAFFTCFLFINEHNRIAIPRASTARTLLIGHP